MESDMVPLTDGLLSIDIGIKNLGWAYFNGNSLEFGIFVIDSGKKTKESTVIHRCRRINDFFKMFGDKPMGHIVIERQVITNVSAMELMYVITMKAMTITDNVFIFDPKLKFTYYHETYDTKNKAHKKQSIEKAHRYLSEHHEELLYDFEDYDKLDDISDAINQGITYMDMQGISYMDMQGIA